MSCDTSIAGMTRRTDRIRSDQNGNMAHEIAAEALIATLFAIERGEIDNFTMRHFRVGCGSPAYICGWARQSTLT
jgi:hypothetical protein